MKETRGTADWAYRCSADGTDAAATIELLTDEGFLWRSVHNSDGNKIANVKKIEIGDSIDPVLECFTGFRLQKDNYPKIPTARPRWVGRNAITRIAR